MASGKRLSSQPSPVLHLCIAWLVAILSETQASLLVLPIGSCWRSRCVVWRSLSRIHVFLFIGELGAEGRWQIIQRLDEQGLWVEGWRVFTCCLSGWIEHHFLILMCRYILQVTSRFTNGDTQLCYNSLVVISPYLYLVNTIIIVFWIRNYIPLFFPLHCML